MIYDYANWTTIEDCSIIVWLVAIYLLLRLPQSPERSLAALLLWAGMLGTTFAIAVFKNPDSLHDKIRLLAVFGILMMGALAAIRRFRKAQD